MPSDGQAQQGTGRGWRQPIDRGSGRGPAAAGLGPRDDLPTRSIAAGVGRPKPIPGRRPGARSLGKGSRWN
jgi:hypothetical protein